MMLISAVEQSDSVIIYILFYILFHYGLSQDTEYSSLCSPVGPCCLSILDVTVCICSAQPPTLPLLGNHKAVLHVCESVSFCHILDSTDEQHHVVFIFHWLVSLSMIISRCIRVAANALFHFYGRVIFHCMYVPSLCHVHSSVNGHVSCFHVLATVNSTALNIEVHGSFRITVLSHKHWSSTGSGIQEWVGRPALAPDLSWGHSCCVHWRLAGAEDQLPCTPRFCGPKSSPGCSQRPQGHTDWPSLQDDWQQSCWLHTPSGDPRKSRWPRWKPQWLRHKSQNWPLSLCWGLLLMLTHPDTNSPQAWSTNTRRGSSRAVQEPGKHTNWSFCWFFYYYLMSQLLHKYRWN